MERFDKVLKNCRALDVRTGGVGKADIAFGNGLIAAVGENLGDGEDCGGLFALPGFIDAHVHIESSQLIPSRFAEAVVPCGTTTVVADPHEIANVCGMDGVDFMIADAAGTPLEVKMMMPSCVPASPAESGGAVLDASAVAAALARDDIFGLGEMMNYPGVTGGDAEALAKLAAGMDVFIRQGSAGKQLLAILPAVNECNIARFSLCTDDCCAADILNFGHIDRILAQATAAGVPAANAVRMATLNPAEHYGLNCGAIERGRQADVVLVPDLENFKPLRVYKRGVLVAERGKALFNAAPADLSKVTNTLRMPPVTADKLRLAGTARRYALKMQAGSLIKELAPFKEGLPKLCVAERHKNTGRTGVCALDGYGIKGGAIALSISHDAHNVVCAGDSDADMRLAINSLLPMGGGICAVKDGKLALSLALPVAGLMSCAPAEQTAAKMTAINDFCKKQLRVNAESNPVMALSFLALTVIPHACLTDRGLFDADKFRFIQDAAV